MSSNDKRKILIIPSVQEGQGTGHLRRSIRLFKDFSSLGVYSAIFVKEEDLSRASLMAKMEACSEGVFLCTPDAAEWTSCIFDYKDTPIDLFKRFNKKAFTIGIDEGGSQRKNFDYLIDTMPNLENSIPNIFSTGFLELPKNRKKDIPQAFIKAKKILITFGGEDKADLTGRLLAKIKQEQILPLSDITIIKGPLYKDKNYPDGVNIIDSPKELFNMFSNWDLVITSFGLSCFEALFSKTPVILFNPTKYHQQLSIKAGIPEIGVLELDIDKLKRYFAQAELLIPAIQRYSVQEEIKLADYIALMKPSVNKCRSCKNPHDEMIHRNREFSFFRCSNCGLINQINIFYNEKNYDSKYFFEEYKNQYGRTYLEDFDKIKETGINRCKLIKKYKPEGRLIDIGCGYGPFLSAAKQLGYDVYGIDTSEDAINMVSDKLGFPAISVTVEDFNHEMFGVEKFDVVTMWFVIEHLKSLPKVLSGINKMLKKGGVFALSTPNVSGISCRKNPSSFLDSNPIDHYTIWEPVSAVKLLKRYGFEVKFVKCPVIHPERFFKSDIFYSFPLPIRAFLKLVLSFIGRIFKLGDTFEIYAVKINDGEGE